MMKRMKEKMKNRKGFTLVELVVVIAILGILAAIAVPKLSQSRTNAANSAHDANVRTLESAATMFIAEEGAVAQTWTSTGGSEPVSGTDKWGLYLQKWPKVPTGRTGGTSTDEYKVEITATGDITVTPPVTPPVTTP